MKHLKFILICMFFCITHLAAAEGGIKLTPVRHSKDRGVPYSVGIHAEFTRPDFTYKTIGGNLFLNSYGVGIGPDIRLSLKNGSLIDSYVIGSIGYKVVRHSENDILADRKAYITSSHISAKAIVGVTISGFTGFYIGMSGDFLTWFRGSEYSYNLCKINRECLNSFIPYLVVGYSFSDYCYFDAEIPLNAGLINLERYSYYNRERISFNRYFTINITVRFRLFGSHHK